MHLIQDTRPRLFAVGFVALCVLAIEVVADGDRPEFVGVATVHSGSHTSGMPAYSDLLVE